MSLASVLQARLQSLQCTEYTPGIIAKQTWARNVMVTCLCMCSCRFNCICPRGLTARKLPWAPSRQYDFLRFCTSLHTLAYRRC